MREVDDALREDEALAALRRYGKPAGAAVIAGLAALGGWLWWQNHQAEAAGRRAETFVLALDRLEAGDLSQASAGIAPLAGSGGNGSQAAARVLAAGIAERQGHAAEAAGLYAAVIADATTPAPYRDLATIRDVALRFDSLAPEQIVERLRPLAAPGAPWFGSAGELLGFAYLKEGRKDLAAPLFGAIARDSSVPDSLRARSRQMAGLLGYDAVEDITTMPDATAPSSGGAAARSQP